jgi:CDP-diacylglycerol--glycerol-3-phosphate 3-phosphatidyltransferase
MDATALRWLPNAITIARLAALPVLAAVILTADGRTTRTGAILFAAVCATDWVDGRLARLLNAQSRLGRVLDPLADRLVIAVGLVGLIVLDRLPWPGPALILVRDALGVGAFVWFARRGVVLHVDLPGKVSSALVMIAVTLALAVDAAWVDVLFWVAVAGSVLTLLNYARTAFRQPQPASEG